MHRELSKVLVTGGAGFIGSAFVRLILNRDCPRQSNKKVSLRRLSLIVVDKLTYAGDLERLKEVKGKYKFYKADICDKKSIDSIFKKEKPDIIVHFSAETHVDRSIQDASRFIKTNIIGTQVLLDVAMKWGVKKLIHISSDEVYGDIIKGKFNEDSPLRPNSPYAASKAAADLLIRSYIRTYAFPAIVVRPCNNYGPWQYPEKLIPLVILRIMQNKKVPVYADGKNIREWLYVEDCARAILKILEKGRIGEIYNLGSGEEKENIEVVKNILGILKKKDDMVEFVKDRPGHDIRYSLDSSRILKEIKWLPRVGFYEGLFLVVSWYLKNKKWVLHKAKS